MHLILWCNDVILMLGVYFEQSCCADGASGEELRAAVEEWQTKRASSTGAPRLTTGFLDGTHPIVDAYELKASLVSLHLA